VPVPGPSDANGRALENAADGRRVDNFAGIVPAHGHDGNGATVNRALTVNSRRRHRRERETSEVLGAVHRLLAAIGRRVADGRGVTPDARPGA
jgi:hypothetical protein